MAKNKKTKRIKNMGYASEDTNDVKRFIIILAIVIVFVVAAYFFTRIFVTKDLLHEDTKEVTSGAINYNNTLIGNMFNKTSEEYFVMLVDTKENRSVFYLGLMNNYVKKEGALPIYLADLSNALNTRFIADEANITENLDEFKVSGPTLVKIKNGKVSKYYTTDDDILNNLKVAEEEKK